MPTRELKAIWHPARARIFEELTKGPATRSQLVEASGEPLAIVAYHSRVLCRAGCIQPAEGVELNPRDPLFEVV